MCYEHVRIRFVHTFLKPVVFFNAASALQVYIIHIYYEPDFYLYKLPVIPQGLL
jgi:hypothetical protein